VQCLYNNPINLITMKISVIYCLSSIILLSAGIDFTYQSYVICFYPDKEITKRNLINVYYDKIAKTQ